MVGQTTHERQITASTSLAVSSVAHPEVISLSSPNAAILQANLRYTNPEQNPSVSY